MASVRRTLPGGVAHCEIKGPAKLVDVRALILRTRVRFPASPSHDRPLNRDVERFLFMLRFEQRDKLADLPVDFSQLSSQWMQERQDSR